MTDYKKGAILGSILGGLVYFPLFIFYFPLIFSPLIFFLGMFLGAFLGLLFSKLYDFLQSKWKSTGLMHLFVFLFFFVSDLVINEKLVHYGLYGLVSSSGLALIPTVILLPWTVPMFYFCDREEFEGTEESDEIQESEQDLGYWLLSFIGFWFSTFVFRLAGDYVFGQIYIKTGTGILFFLSLGVSVISSIVGCYLIYRKKGKKFNLKVLIYGEIIFLLAFSIFSVSLYQADIFTQGPLYDRPLRMVKWYETCDAGKNWINITVIYEGDDILVDQGATLFVKKGFAYSDNEKITCRWNLSENQMDGEDNDSQWETGEKLSFDMKTNLSSNPCANSTFNINMNQHYISKLRIAGRPRRSDSRTCTGRYY